MDSSPRTRQTGAIIKIKKAAEVSLHGIASLFKMVFRPLRQLEGES
jgi:hypothetical protein